MLLNFDIQSITDPVAYYATVRQNQDITGRNIGITLKIPIYIVGQGLDLVVD
jgi:hypothetical protein